ncbi:MAG: hypothetical protein JEZ06_24715, partial [Anaerolineaceae bacterium]|nr:hypothetical protein [Anaerolineaceae bacterium]
MASINKLMITSNKNPQIQRLRSLMSRRQKRKKDQAFVAEGIRLIEEAQNAKRLPETIFFDDHLSDRG